MVPAPLDVEGEEVHARAVRGAFGEQTFSDLFGEEPVVGLGAQVTYSSQESVHAPLLGVIYVGRSEEGLEGKDIITYLLCL